MIFAASSKQHGGAALFPNPASLDLPTAQLNLRRSKSADRSRFPWPRPLPLWEAKVFAVPHGRLFRIEKQIVRPD
jgi:hypothetical protein